MEESWGGNRGYRLYRGYIRMAQEYGAKSWSSGVKKLNVHFSTERKMLKVIC